MPTLGSAWLWALAVVGLLVTHGQASAGPAPAISSYQIYAVRSAQSPNWEYPNASAVITANDHGGAYIDVAVLEMGYSTSRMATMDTYGMTLIDTLNVTNNTGAIVGYIYVFRITKGFTSGTVSTSATSINSGARWSDSIRIK